MHILVRFEYIRGTVLQNVTGAYPTTASQIRSQFLETLERMMRNLEAKRKTLPTTTVMFLTLKSTYKEAVPAVEIIPIICYDAQRKRLLRTSRTNFLCDFDPWTTIEPAPRTF